MDVLLVESDGHRQLLMNEVLTSAGHRVRVANSGVEAIGNCTVQLPDLILLTWNLAGFDGQTTARWLRLAFGGRTGIVAIGTASGVSEGELTAGVDVDAFLPTSHQAGELLRLVAEFPMSIKAGNSAVSRAPTTDDHEHSADALAVSDIPGALMRLGGDEELLHDLIGFFFEDSWPLMDKISHAIAHQDWDAARRAAHSLKGLVSNFGAAAAAEACRKLEVCQTDSQADFVALIPDIEVQLRRLALALAEFTVSNCAAKQSAKAAD